MEKHVRVGAIVMNSSSNWIEVGRDDHSLQTPPSSRAVPSSKLCVAGVTRVASSKLCCVRFAITRDAL